MRTAALNSTEVVEEGWWLRAPLDVAVSAPSPNEAFSLKESQGQEHEPDVTIYSAYGG